MIRIILLIILIASPVFADIGVNEVLKLTFIKSLKVNPDQNAFVADLSLNGRNVKGTFIKDYRDTDERMYPRLYKLVDGNDTYYFSGVVKEGKDGFAGIMANKKGIECGIRKGRKITVFIEEMYNKEPDFAKAGYDPILESADYRVYKGTLLHDVYASIVPLGKVGAIAIVKIVKDGKPCYIKSSVSGEMASSKVQFTPLAMSCGKKSVQIANGYGRTTASETGLQGTMMVLSGEKYNRLMNEIIASVKKYCNSCSAVPEGAEGQKYRMVYTGAGQLIEMVIAQ